MALSQAALSAGFSDHEVAILKMKWQEMAPQHRAAAKRCLDAMAARVQRLPQGSGVISRLLAPDLQATSRPSWSTL